MSNSAGEVGKLFGNILEFVLWAASMIILFPTIHTWVVSLNAPYGVSHLLALVVAAPCAKIFAGIGCFIVGIVFLVIAGLISVLK